MRPNFRTIRHRQICSDWSIGPGLELGDFPDTWKNLFFSGCATTYIISSNTIMYKISERPLILLKLKASFESGAFVNILASKVCSSSSLISSRFMT